MFCPQYETTRKRQSWFQALFNQQFAILNAKYGALVRTRSYARACDCNAQNAGRLPYKIKAPFGALATLPSHTASFAAFTGRALMTFRAGLALNSIGSLVKGLMPLRAMVAGFLM